ncbi:MAG TPA: hypothetical protein VKQ72_19460 [Aggregatilineales bacterium]|nr:hypothetical protein [Aggregatilineales bacterium]
MATLQTARQSSAFTARSRLQQVIRDYPPEISVLSTHTAHAAPAHSQAEHLERVEESIPASLPVREERGIGGSYRRRLSELDQHQILLNATAIYPGWCLVSLQRRPENDELVAYLVREADQSDPAAAIRDGRTMQIMMDVMGDMKVQYDRRRRSGRFARWLGRLVAAIG